MNASIKFVDEVITLSGELTFNTVQGLLDQSKKLVFPNKAIITFDLAQVTNVDSSALALCLALMKKIQAEDNRILYRGVPSALLAIAQSVGVEDLFNYSI